MNKIIRLSKANMNRHKKETVLLGLLVMLCAILLASSVTSLMGIKKIVPKMVEESGCYRNNIYINQNIYSDKFLSFLEQDERVADYAHASMVYDEEMKIRNYRGFGDDALYDVCFMAESGEKEIEKFQVKTSLSKEQIEGFEHPVYLGKSEKEKLRVSEGDTLTILIDNKEYTFSVAGFYDTGLGMTGTKFVVNDQDFRVLEDYLTRYEIIGFQEAMEADVNEIIKDFQEYVKENSVNDTNGAIHGYAYSMFVSNAETNMSLLSSIVIVMAGVIIIAVIVMVRFRIVTDISEQIVSIGVLEAIGYQSKEIALSYILEYVLIALIGCILAILPGISLAKFLLKNAAASIYYCGQVEMTYFATGIVMVGLLLFVGLVAMTKALSVNQYPPVMAFRKGIATHHFKKNFFPLEKTKGNVHIRLALKDFLQNIGKRIGFTVCITVSTIMVLISFALGTFFSDGDRVLQNMSGHELADISLVAMGGTDPESFAEELRSMPEVDRVLLSASSVAVAVNDSDIQENLDIYQDFSETKTTIVTKGRLPKYDNEIAITTQGAMIHLAMGQTVTLEYNKVKRDYLVCGVVNSMVNPQTIYMTEDGFKNLNPLYTPNTYKIFLRDDADRDAFVSKLTQRYGENITDIKNSEVTGDTYEERLQSAARIKMAKAMSESGVSYMEYAIRVGDRVITGSTHNMKIESMDYEHDTFAEMIEQASQAFEGVAFALMMVSAVVVIIMLSILMSSAIRMQYKDLGIMKGIGYTSRELKFQMAFTIIPPTVISVVIGSILGKMGLGLLEMVVVRITIPVFSIVCLDCGILLFCFLCAYINARKIGKISVYELMTE